MTHRVREYTNRIVALLDEGVLDQEDFINMVLNWMSEADVKEMYLANGISVYGEDEEEDDGPSEQSMWYDTSAELT